ncbi:MAG: hypothetical protein M0Z83_06730 [Betaproteobacteria bacterium]|nr:hypothetical protein [Betaproteobacteria bacterium]
MSSNIQDKDFPMPFEVFGDGIAAEKLHKRLSCALRGLGFNPVVGLRPMIERPSELDDKLEPFVLAGGRLWVEGLPRTEEIELLLRKDLKSQE